MGSAWEYPLSPMDNLMLAIHEALQFRGYCGLNVVMLADLEGPLDAAALREAAARVGRNYPALSARIAYSRLLGRPYWKIDPQEDPATSLGYEYLKMDPATADPNEPFQRALNQRYSPTEPRPVRLIHVQTSDQHHRIGLCWPHYFMDLEGAHRLFAELHAALTGGPSTLGRDPTARTAPPFGLRFPTTCWRTWQGRIRYARLCGIHQPRLVAKPEGERKSAHFLIRHYDAAFRGRFEEAARRRLTPGPMLYGRAVLAALARTYLAMCEEKGRKRERYLFSYTAPLPRQGERLGIHGNDVTIPGVVCTREDLTSAAAADAVIWKQYGLYAAGRGEQAEWCAMRATQHWPFALTRRLMRHQMPGAAAGFTCYRFGSENGFFGQARVTNLTAIGTMNCHPGWIVGHFTYGQTMTIEVTYFTDYLDHAGATELLDRMDKILVD